MAAQGSPSVLERKLAAAAEADRGTGRSALRALRLALARTAKDLFDLPLAVIGAKQGRCDNDGVAGFLDNTHLLVLLEGSAGFAGAVSLDSPCVGALIQQQTMSRVTGNPMAERAFTGTDAALVGPLIETLLSRAADLADLPQDRSCLSGFRFGARVEDVRSLLLTLEADRFRVFNLTIDIAEGAMQGVICLLLPDLPAEAQETGTRGAAAVAPGPRLEQAFGVMRADLTATICRLRLSLSELAAMQPGDVLPLTRERLEETELITINGQPIAAGRLGQVNGLRALRLNETVVVPDLAQLATQDGFANQVVPEEAAGDDPLTMDGSVAPIAPLPLQQAGLPVVIEPGPDDKAIAEQEMDSDNLLDRMTPQEAAAEISQLAGLSAEDAVE